MYSVVLMAALTTGVDLPDLGRRGGGCCGCHGGYGGCYGGWGGCYGGGFGYGGWGGCYGGGFGYGGWGGCYGGGFGYGGCYGGYGLGGYGFGGGMLMPGTGAGAGQQHRGTGGERLGNPPREKGSKEETMVPTPATIVVELPADAQLLIGGQATASTGSSRVFETPELNPGREYQYTVKAQAVRDGKPVTVEQVITVQAGVTTPVTLTLPATGVAQR